MAKLTRQTASVFAQAAEFQEVAQFGSLAANAPLFTTNIETIQALANWLGGWSDAVIGGNSPAIEDMNGFCYVMAYQIAYALQSGISEYDDGTTYYIGSLVNIPVVIFDVTSASATVGATYTNSGSTFTVLGTIAAATRLVCYAATGAPAASGTLTKSAGTGDSTITYSVKRYQTSTYVSVADGSLGHAITDTTYWAPFQPAVGRPFSHLASDSTGSTPEYSYNTFNLQTAEANVTVPAGYNLSTAYFTIPTGITYAVAGSIACMGKMTVVGTLTLTGDGTVV